MKLSYQTSILLFAFTLCGCNLVGKKETIAELDKMKEFDDKMAIKEIDPPKAIDEIKSKDKPTAKKVSAKKAKVEPKNKNVNKEKVEEKRQPEFEDTKGFIGRRPIKDPYRVDEKTVLAVKYFGMVAGDLTMSVDKMIEVNGRKSYSFTTSLKSNPSFAIFYEVDDVIKAFLDYQDLVPVGYTLRIRETNDVKEGRNVFDWQKLQSQSWIKEVDEGKIKESKEDFDLLPYSQNVYTAAYYLRNFSLVPGEKLIFRVADKGKTLLFKGEVIRKETLDTPVGKLNTVIVKPQFELDGIFKPVGDIYMWLTDDERKFIVRLECKIKIGKIVAELKSLEPGQIMP